MATPHDDSGSKLQTATETAIFKYFTPTLLTFSVFVGGAYMHDMKMDLMALKEARADERVLQATDHAVVVQLQAMKSQRDAQVDSILRALDSQSKDIALLQFQVNHSQEGHR